MTATPAQTNPYGVKFQRLTETQTEKIYAACLEILDRTGVRLYDQEALDLLKKAGLTVFDDNRVRIPPYLVEQARRSAPNEVILHNRTGEPVMPLGDRRSFYGTGSDCLNIIDHRTNLRRTPVLQDVTDALTVIDALPQIDFGMSMFLPEDVPQQVADRHQMQIMLNRTSKPLVFVTTEFSGCVDAIEMAEAVVGGPTALREKPITTCYINVTTGLRHNEEALQKLLFLVGKGLPAIYVPSAQGGVTAPVTPAAALAVSQAGGLVGLVLSQLKNEGTPIILPGWGGNMLDMRTTVQPYADPDKRAMGPDFAHYLGLPMFALAGCSDSKQVDQQAAIEAALSLMTDTLCGGHLVHDVGYLESGMTGSLAQLAICAEIISWLDHFVQEPVVDDEALALDLIDEIGPDGQFLDSDHTFDHFRERWYPSLFDRGNYASWLAEGGQNLGERAAQKVAEILTTHTPDPLPEAVQNQLQAITDRAASHL